MLKVIATDVVALTLVALTVVAVTAAMIMLMTVPSINRASMLLFRFSCEYLTVEDEVSC